MLPALMRTSPPGSARCSRIGPGRRFAGSARPVPRAVHRSAEPRPIADRLQQTQGCRSDRQRTVVDQNVPGNDRQGIARSRQQNRFIAHLYAGPCGAEKTKRSRRRDGERTVAAPAPAVNTVPSRKRQVVRRAHMQRGGDVDLCAGTERNAIWVDEEEIRTGRGWYSFEQAIDDGMAMPVRAMKMLFTFVAVVNTAASPLPTLESLKAMEQIAAGGLAETLRYDIHVAGNRMGGPPVAVQQNTAGTGERGGRACPARVRLDYRCGTFGGRLRTTLCPRRSSRSTRATGASARRGTHAPALVTDLISVLPDRLPGVSMIGRAPSYRRLKAFNYSLVCV